MKKLRFKNRNGVLYFGIDGKFRSSKLKFTKINQNIIIGKYQKGLLNDELGFRSLSSPKLKNLIDDVLNERSLTLKYSSMRIYKGIFEKHILPYFKDKYVTEIKPIDIKKFQDSLIAKDYGRTTINHSRGILSDAFELAIIEEYVDINPIKMISSPKSKKRKVKQNPFNLDEIDDILDTKDLEIRNFLGISIFTGMRSGELLALKWEDIDFNTDTVSITKTISAGLIGTTKTFSSNRDIELIDKARIYFKSQQLVTGLKNNFVFLNSKNTHHICNAVITYKYKNILKSLNLEARSLHNTRHTFASIMLNNKIEPLWVSKTLGHENLKITLDTYTHYIPRSSKMVLEFLDKRYKNSTQAV